MARILFVQNFWFEYLGTMILSGILKREGHVVDLLIDPKRAKLLQAIEAFNPDIIGMYTTSGSHGWVLETAKIIKKNSDVMILLGGPHPTFFPEIIKEDAIDVICIGEADEAISELAVCIDNHQDVAGIKNLWIKVDGVVQQNPLRPLLTDLDSLPAPDRALYYKYSILRKSPSKHFISGRGCPFNCSFCCNRAYKTLYQNLGPMVRRPSPEKICREIQEVKRNYPLKSVRFDDEVFLLQPDWLLDFLDQYKQQVNLPFSCLIRADLLTEQLARAMKKAGCYIAYFGVESGNDEIRNHILGKGVDRDQIIYSAGLLRRNKIKIGTFNMVGMPGETFENAWETVRLNQIIRSDQPWCSIIQPYPGTELEENAKKAGYLDCNYGVNDLQQSYFNDSVITNPDSPKLVVLQKLFYLAVKFPCLSGMIKKVCGNGGHSRLIRWVFNITYGYRYSKTYKMPMYELLKRAILWKDNY